VTESTLKLSPHSRTPHIARALCVTRRDHARGADGRGVRTAAVDARVLDVLTMSAVTGRHHWTRVERPSREGIGLLDRRPRDAHRGYSWITTWSTSARCSTAAGALESTCCPSTPRLDSSRPRERLFGCRSCCAKEMSTSSCRAPAVHRPRKGSPVLAQRHATFITGCGHRSATATFISRCFCVMTTSARF